MLVDDQGTLMGMLISLELLCINEGLASSMPSRHGGVSSSCTLEHEIPLAQANQHTPAHSPETARRSL